MVGSFCHLVASVFDYFGQLFVIRLMVLLTEAIHMNVIDDVARGGVVEGEGKNIEYAFLAFACCFAGFDVLTYGLHTALFVQVDNAHHFFAFVLKC